MAPRLKVPRVAAELEADAASPAKKPRKSKHSLLSNRSLTGAFGHKVEAASRVSALFM